MTDTQNNAVTAAVTPDFATISNDTVALYGNMNFGGFAGFGQTVNGDAHSVTNLFAQKNGLSLLAGFFAGQDVRVLANDLTAGKDPTADASKFRTDLDNLSGFLTTANNAAGYGFIAGLTEGGAVGLINAGGGNPTTVPSQLQATVLNAINNDATGATALGTAVTSAGGFAGAWFGGVIAGGDPFGTLRSIEATSLTT